MYCNYCDKTHRELFQLTAYSCNSTYDAANQARVTEDLYSMDDVSRNYETYMDYYCDALYDASKPLASLLLCVIAISCKAVVPSCPIYVVLVKLTIIKPGHGTINLHGKHKFCLQLQSL